MDPSAVPARGAPRPYRRDPDPAPSYYPPSAPSNEEGMDQSDGGDPIYAGSPVSVVRERERRNHLPHRVNHPHPRAARP
jgi:hypothetical protein